MTHPGSVGLALVTESNDEHDDHNGQDDGEQDADIIMWLEEKDDRSRL